MIYSKSFLFNERHMKKLKDADINSIRIKCGNKVGHW